MERKSIGVKKRLGLPALLTLTYFIVSALIFQCQYNEVLSTIGDILIGLGLLNIFIIIPGEISYCMLLDEGAEDKFGREILCIILTGIGTLMAIMAVFMINSNPKSAIALLFLLIIYIVEIFVKHKSKTKG